MTKLCDAWKKLHCKGFHCWLTAVTSVESRYSPLSLLKRGMKERKTVRRLVWTSITVCVAFYRFSNIHMERSCSTSWYLLIWKHSVVLTPQRFELEVGKQFIDHSRWHLYVFARFLSLFANELQLVFEYSDFWIE